MVRNCSYMSTEMMYKRFTNIWIVTETITISELQIFFAGIALLAKQHIDCCKMGNGIGLAVFGRQARLIQEATNDYEFIVELIGNISYIFIIS